MSDPIRPIGVQPTGDDQEFSQEVIRTSAEFIARIAELESRVTALEARTN